MSLRNQASKERCSLQSLWKECVFLAFGSLELVVGVTRIPDLENTIEKAYKKENQANFFVFNLWDQRQEEHTGVYKVKACVHKKEVAWGISGLHLRDELQGVLEAVVPQEERVFLLRL